MFRKILIWFGIALIVSVAGFVATTFWIMRRGGGPGDFFERSNSYFVAEAVHVYETSGKDALREYFDRRARFFRGPQYLLDSQGRDVLTGEDRSELLKHPPEARQFMKWPSKDGRYQLVAEVPVRPGLSWYLPLYAWILVPAVLLVYALTLSLVRPVRQLRDGVVRFGRGDLASRSNLARNDELGELARAFDDMATRIQTLLTAERRLLQDVSHELRSPLARLGFAAELARSSPDREAAIGRIKKEVAQLASLVDELIEVTRAEGDPAVRHLESVDLAELTRSLAADSALEAEQAHCVIDLHAPAPAPVNADRKLIRRAIDNVLRNAIRYAPGGSAVDVDIECEGGFAMVGVRDYGPGIPAEALAQIFRPFFRVEGDRSRDKGGVGLGLAIAQRAVQLHGGEIVALNMDPGLMVRVKLPVASA